MTKLNQTLAALLVSCAMTSTAPAFANEESSAEDPDEKYLYQPKQKQPDFETEVDPIHDSSLQGFDCMDEDGDGYLTDKELEKRDDCVENPSERDLEPSTRTKLILDRLDADRDARVSKREFNIWNEMRRQQN
ncbi:hypothetical protein [Marinobacter sp.]|uniref:hypothetical protein n=1 Tax=Marinobacter sp. TaxID=50741 RepID=UPI0034A23FCC